MSRAFDAAFDLIKTSHFQATYGPEFFLKAIGGPEVESMRQYVLMNEQHPHPDVQESVEDVYQHLTALAGGQETPKPRMFSMQELSEMAEQAEMEPVSTADPEGTVDARATPMQKAFYALMNAHFLRKNVVGFGQGGQEYKMPPSIASMAQRQQMPETIPQTMETQAPGMFGRFKQPVRQTAQIPTGQMSLGQRAGPVQGNLPHPMGGANIGAAPGAQVTRMPRPGPYGGYGSGDGYNHNSVRHGNFNTFSATNDLRQPMGSDSHYYQMGSAHADPVNRFGVSQEQMTQDAYGDQFNPNRQF